MSDLAKQAKTPEEILRITRMPHGFSDSKWVSLEDADKAIQDLENNTKIMISEMVKQLDAQPKRYGQLLGKVAEFRKWLDSQNTLEVFPASKGERWQEYFRISKKFVEVFGDE